VQIVDGDGCWQWQGFRNPVSKRGVLYAGEDWPTSARTVYAHRVAWFLTHGPIPDGKLVCHRCDNPPCVRPDHLFLGTSEENNHDAIRKGRDRHPKGGRGRPKLTGRQVQAIRERYSAGGIRLRELASEYDVHEATISRLVAGKRWASLTE
jgi:hypothetical protein